MTPPSQQAPESRLTHLGSYLIDRELGAGGMGRVYLARCEEALADLPAGSRVALKLLHPHLLESAGLHARFLREAELSSRVRHPNVVRTLSHDVVAVDEDTHAFLVMEYVEGETLRGLLGRVGRVPEQGCRHIAHEICAGLCAIHAVGALHRDLKPENVIVTHEDVVKVMDLGIAHLTDSAMRLSMTGAFIGAVKYAAPEQFEDGTVDARTDLHGLGVVLYELATGEHPYPGRDYLEVMRRVCEGSHRRLREVNPTLSPFLETVTDTLLASAPEDRFQSAQELLAVLEAGTLDG